MSPAIMRLWRERMFFLTMVRRAENCSFVRAEADPLWRLLSLVNLTGRQESLSPASLSRDFRRDGSART